MSLPTISIAGLNERHHGLTEEVAAYYAQGARVCLDRHHEPPRNLQIEMGSITSECSLSWEVTTQDVKLAWGNDDDATRDGAYIVALAALEHAEGLVAVHRAQSRSGADYFVAPSGTPKGDIENAIRLEVSGIDRSDPSKMRARLQQKKDQTRRGESDAPAIAAVVGFSSAVVQMERVTE
jgi:hypothetical protein